MTLNDARNVWEKRQTAKINVPKSENKMGRGAFRTPETEERNAVTQERCGREK